VGDQFVGGGGAGLAEHADRVHRLAQTSCGMPKHGDLEHGGVGGQGVLHLDAVHVLPAGDDHVLGPVDEEQIALVVEYPTSPLRYQPSCSACAVSSGLFRYSVRKLPPRPHNLAGHGRPATGLPASSRMES